MTILISKAVNSAAMTSMKEKSKGIRAPAIKPLVNSGELHYRFVSNSWSYDLLLVKESSFT